CDWAPADKENDININDNNEAYFIVLPSVNHDAGSQIAGWLSRLRRGDTRHPHSYAPETSPLREHGRVQDDGEWLSLGLDRLEQQEPLAVAGRRELVKIELDSHLRRKQDRWQTGFQRRSGLDRN